MIPGDIDVTVVPDDANNIVGDESANVLNGTTGDDLIAGNAGADTISGDAGDDILAGGLGADSITTGADADVVVFNAAELAEATSGFGGVFDLLTDFSQGFDNVDLTDLFTVDNSNGADGDDVSDFVRLVSEGGVEYLQVDANGGSDEADFVTIAQFGLDMTAVGVIFSDADDPDGVNQQSVIL